MARRRRYRVEVTGTAELQHALDMVARELADAMETGTNEAAEVVAGMVRAQAPVGPTGNLRRGVQTKRLSRSDVYPATTLVGVDYGIAPHQHLVEFGTGPRYAKGTGAYRGQMPPQPFFRATIDAARGVIKGILRERGAGALRR